MPMGTLILRGGSLLMLGSLCWPACSFEEEQSSSVEELPHPTENVRSA